MIIKFIKSLEFYLRSVISQTVRHLCNGLVLTILLRKVFPCGKWKKMTVERKHPFQSGSCPSKQSRAKKYDSVRLLSCKFKVHHLVYVRCDHDWHETISMSVNPMQISRPNSWVLNMPATRPSSRQRNRGISAQLLYQQYADRASGSEAYQVYQLRR